MATFTEARNVSQAWVRGCEAIIARGFRTKGKIKLLNLIVDIRNLDRDESFEELYGRYMDMEVFKRTVEIVSSDKSFGLHPSYWKRLKGKEKFRVDQISQVISRLKKQPHSTKLTLQIYTPDDFQEKYTPCILCVELRVERQNLSMSVFIRSQDFGRKSYADYIGLSHILQRIAEDSSIPLGGMVVHTVTASINRQDLPRVSALLSKTRP